MIHILRTINPISMQPRFLASYQHNKTLYQILQVAQNATQTQIKQAYYKLAQQYHPDKNHNLQHKHKFTQINNAYKILSAKQHPKHHQDIPNHQQDQQQINQHPNIFTHTKSTKHSHKIIDQILNQIFTTFQSKPNPKSNIYIDLQLTFKEALKGTTKKISYQQKQFCKICKGSHSLKNSKCKCCKGHGSIFYKQFGMLMEQVCHQCYGFGFLLNNNCKSCQGTGLKTQLIQQEIIIPKGIANGSKIKIKGKNNINDNVIIKIKVSKHPNIQRKGIDAYSQIQISVADAVLGCNATFKTIQGNVKTISIPRGTQNGHKITIRKIGFHGSNQERGNHIISIKILIPKNTSTLQKQIYQQLKSLQQNEI